MMRAMLFGLAMAIALPGISLAQSVQNLAAKFEKEVQGTVTFGFNKDHVGRDARNVLDQQAAWMKANPNARVRIFGHADAVGSAAYNKDLGMRRARAVEAYLVTQGVADSRMDTVVSFGEEKLAVASTKRERRNRRVVTEVIGLVKTVMKDPGLACTDPAESTLLASSDAGSLRAAVEELRLSAETTYDRELSNAILPPAFFWAGHAKTACGIANGYLSTGTQDAGSIGRCDCYHSRMKQAQSQS